MSDFLKKSFYVGYSRYNNLRGLYESQYDAHLDTVIYVNEKSRLKLFHYSNRYILSNSTDIRKNNYMLLASFPIDSNRSPAEAKWPNEIINFKEYVPITVDEPVGLFKDIEFDTVEKSIAMPSLNYDEILWVRGSQLGYDMKLFDKIEPLDLLQGGVGDCWLIAALASLAEFPKSLKSIFDEDTLSKQGKYTLNLYNPQLKEFIKVVVDDYIPCHKYCSWYEHNKPLFSQPHGSELYPLLLEKAVAKLGGSYNSMNGGHPAIAWMILTGCEDITYWYRYQNRSAPWIKGQFHMDPFRNTPWNYQQGPFRFTNERKRDDDLFDILKNSDEKNYIMSAAIITNDEEVEKQREDGLIERHAYSVIKVFQNEHVRLLQIRNPWGNSHEYNGPWSDYSNEWRNHPEVYAELKPYLNKFDGMFWMPYEYFIKSFNNVQICNKSMEH